MTDYTTVQTLRAYLGDPGGTVDGGPLQSAITAASRRIDTICARSFTVPSSATDKVFAPGSWWHCDFVDLAGQRWDLSSTTSLAVHVDTGYDGTYATTLTNNTDFLLVPENGTKYGQPWPYEGMRALSNSGATFPLQIPGYRSTVKVTGKWGWTAVPDGVIQACLILAAQIFKNRDNVGGFQGFDAGVVRVREDPLALTMLEPYITMSRFVA